MRSRYVSMLSSSLLAASLTSACSDKKDTPAPPAAVTPSAGAAQEPAKVAPTEAAPASSLGFVLHTTAVKRAANNDAKVDDGKGKQVSNWLATLYRGERVTVIKEEGDFFLAKTSGEVEGFIKKTSVLNAPDVTEATVVEPTDAFDRPDLLALNSKKKVEPGTLVFVVKQREQFSEVNAVGTSTVWVLNGRLTNDKDEIAVAKLLAKARSLKESKDVADLVGLAKNNFPNAKLVATMDTLVAAAAPEGASGETAAPAPSGEAEPAKAQ